MKTILLLIGAVALGWAAAVLAIVGIIFLGSLILWVVITLEPMHRNKAGAK
jgi:hypothetical protein